MKILNDYHMKTILQNAKEHGIPFKLEQTGTMKRLIISDGRKFSTRPKSKLNSYELNLIKRVKDGANKLDLKSFPNVTNRDVPYIKNSLRIRLGSTYRSQLYELDLSSAYWNFAVQNGVIDETTYNFAKSPKISKGARLVSLGALAKKPLITEFDGQKFKMYQAEELETAKLFYLCALFTGQQMIDLERIINQTAKSKFLFFWVDAIFFQGDNAMKNIVDELNNKNIGFKLYKLNRVTMKKEKIIVCSNDHKKKERIFNVEKPNKKINVYE